MTVDLGHRAVLREPTGTIRGATPLAPLAIDEGGGGVARPCGDQGSPHPSNALHGRGNVPIAQSAASIASGTPVPRKAENS
jgi:hypothetical protein